MKPLTRDEVKTVIEGKGHASRVPIAIQDWISTDLFGAHKYPSDIHVMHIHMPSMFDAPVDDPAYRWMSFDKPEPTGDTAVAIDADVCITDWAQLDEIIADFPNADYHGLTASNAPDDGRYRVGLWWFWLFERLWSFRGMENALVDFYESPDEVHKLFRVLTDFYKDVLTRCKHEMQLDAIWTSDDIGTQTGPFFSPGIFDEFFKPYYKELIDHAHSLGMHFWMHTCGNIIPFIPELIDIGLDVLHPIQKYTMDEKEIAERFGNKICFWAGFDVQQIIPYGTPEDVRREVRFMIDTYFRTDGRFMLAAGNWLTPDTPAESIEALFDEAYKYGALVATTRRT
ncbi:MAG: methylcobamide--CoM methyltransferase [Defluviitaleaceae bacterium]|nr:methylcobamide--CoM methyltransferase [Defluviitaleaceae bacterium]